MFKKLLFLSTILVVCITLYGQDTKTETAKPTTKMDVFNSKTGIIIKYTDTELPNMATLYATSETRIRKISNGDKVAYFYQIMKEGKYSKSTASIEYVDLVEVLKALKTLKAEVNNDVASNPDYLENKFVTVDGFQVGYYVSGGKATWYLKLERYGSDNSLYIENVEVIESAFTKAKDMIDALSNDYKIDFKF